MNDQQRQACSIQQTFSNAPQYQASNAWAPMRGKGDHIARVDDRQPFGHAHKNLRDIACMDNRGMDDRVPSSAQLFSYRLCSRLQVRMCLRAVQLWCIRFVLCRRARRWDNTPQVQLSWLWRGERYAQGRSGLQRRFGQGRSIKGDQGAYRTLASGVLIAERARRLMKNQHGDATVARDMLGDAAQGPAFEAGCSAAAQNNQVDRPGSRC